mmetsp:Transcript_29052/g.28747  ORF Transcript_29052/g.28747 Transcript_29052/m.28747 type:complete len:431 (-) Transcript_29052:37-1329(-)
MKGADEELPDYNESDADQEENKGTKTRVKKSGFSGIHSAGFSEFLLKEELINAIHECGFEHPSEVQQEALPQAMNGCDIICQAKSGMGKTAVFVLAVLHQLESPVEPVSVLVLAHVRELAFQIKREFDRFSKRLEGVRTEVFYGGVPLSEQVAALKTPPAIIVGTPGRILALARKGTLKLDKIRYFIMDECDKMLEKLDMRSDVQHIFRMTPHEKQVMMFSATMNKEIRNVFRKFAQNQVEIFIDDETKLTLHGLQQYYVRLSENEKNRRLIDLLDALQFNQVVIFVKSVSRAIELNKILVESSFPSTAIHAGLNQEERINRFKAFKDFNKRVMVATDVFGRGIDIERVNIVVNYDMPQSEEKTDARENNASNTYLHRVGRAGRFGTKGLAISFISSDEDTQVLNEIQERFLIAINELPATINISSYMNT